MKHVNRLTDQQQKFLRMTRDGVVLVPQVLDQLGLTPQRLARWMRRDFFRDALGETRTEMRRVHWLDLELLARSAVATLQSMLVKPSKRSLFLLLLCVAILMEHDRTWKRLHRGKRGRKRRKFEDPADLCHPDSRDRNDELLRQLETLD